MPVPAAGIVDGARYVPSHAGEAVADENRADEINRRINEGVIFMLEEEEWCVGRDSVF